jgi:ribonuclease R
MKPGAEIAVHEVLALLATRGDPVSIRQMAEALGARHKGRRELAKMVARLKRKGKIEERSPGRFVLAHSKQAGAAPSRGPMREVHNSQQTGKAAGADTPAAGGITGRLVAHRDGYGFVVAEKPVPGVEGDLFVAAPNIGEAMHGDTVAVRILRRRSDGRAEATILRVLKRAHPTVVGLFRYGSRGNVVVPYDARLPQEIIIPPGDELPPALREKLGAHGFAEQRKQRAPRLPELDGAVVDVEWTRFPSGGVVPAGRVVEILGKPGDIGADVEIIIRKHHLPHRFPEEVHAQARATLQQVGAGDLHGREDFRSLPIVTIDGETARDFDDAVHVRRLPGGRYELQVHIADVAHYVRRGAPLDREARLRGTSVYFPNRAVPMLPEELSNGICSLNPHADRLVMSAVLELDARGAVTASRFTNGVIHSAERMTYTSVNKVLEGDAEMNQRYSAQVEHFRLMRELALLLNARRTARGSIDFDLPEPVIEFDELGRMTRIVRSERNIAHRIIEEFMLAANEAVARYLESRGLASLSRVHEKPDPKRVMEFEELARAFGYSLGVANLAVKQITVKHGRAPTPPKRRHGGRGPGRAGHGRDRAMVIELPGALDFDIRPQHYQRLTQKIAGQPEERILSYLMLRSLKQARYAPEPLGHFALAADSYTHFTSPIRRYPDLMVHRVLKWALENTGANPPGPYSLAELEEVAAESSDAERRADLAERELMDWKTAQYMEQHLGEEFEALVISVVKFGMFVELFEVFVEGLVPITALEEFTGARCLFRERDRVIVADGARGPARAFHLGDRVRVRADRIDHFTRRVEFALLSAQPSRRPEKRS